ncbi:AB hydrolase superfamily protein [Abortiporus biennis]
MSCEQCTQGFVLPGEPEGSMVDGAYFHEGPSTTTNTSDDTDSSKPKVAIVLLTDIFGLPLKNSKLIADEISNKVGCDVWIPDVFEGKYIVKAEEMEPLFPDRAGVGISFLSYLRFALLALPRIHLFYANRPSVVDARAKSFIKKIRETKKYEKVGAVGYCFGGAIAVRIGSDPTVVDSIVIAHPGHISDAQIKDIKVPASWECAEEDMSFKTPQRNNAEAIFAARKDKPDYIDYEFKDYKGTFHGFAARPNLGLPEIVEAYNGALEQTVNWFKKTLL